MDPRAMLNSEAFDAATQAALAKLVAKGVDCFGETIVLRRSIEPDCVLRCLAERPMRVRQIAVRTQTHRDAVAAACETLLRTHQIKRDEEAFLFLNPPELH